MDRLRDGLQEAINLVDELRIEKLSYDEYSTLIDALYEAEEREDMIEQGRLVDNDLIQDMLVKTASLHPYKVPGRIRETCSQYNEGWQDALDVFSSALSRLAELEGKKND